MATKKPFNIKETSTITGLSPSVLRIWELRYGWPKPTRRANGYRIYSAALIEDLQWVVGRLAEGKSIRELIDDDGKLLNNKMPKTKKKASTLRLDFSAIPMPATPEGLQLREQVEHAIRIGDEGKITLLQSVAVRLRPAERELAITLLLSAASAPK
jgi:DNA-binding transcriptional MerR regulator